MKESSRNNVNRDVNGNVKANPNKTSYNNTIKKLNPSSSSRNYFKTKSIITNKKSFYSISSKDIRTIKGKQLCNSIDKESLANSIFKIEKQYKIKHQEMRELWSSMHSLKKETKNSILLMEAIITKDNFKKKSSNSNNNSNSNRNTNNNNNVITGANISEIDNANDKHKDKSVDNDASNDRSSLFITNDSSTCSKQILNLQHLLRNFKITLQEHQQKYEEYQQHPKVIKMNELIAKSDNQLNIIEELELSKVKLQARIKDLLLTLKGIVKAETGYKTSIIQTQIKINESQANLNIINELIKSKNHSVEESEKLFLSNKDTISKMKERLKEQEAAIKAKEKSEAEINSKVSEREAYDKRDSNLSRGISTKNNEVEKMKKKIKELMANTVYLETKRDSLEQYKLKIDKERSNSDTNNKQLSLKDKDKLIKDKEVKLEQIKVDQKAIEEKYMKAFNTKAQKKKELQEKIESLNQEIASIAEFNEEKKREIKQRKEILIELEKNDKKREKEKEPLLKKVKKIEEGITKKKLKARKEEKGLHQEKLNQVNNKIQKQREINNQLIKKIEKLNKTIETNKEKAEGLKKQKGIVIQEKEQLLLVKPEEEKKPKSNNNSNSNIVVQNDNNVNNINEEIKPDLNQVATN